MCLKNLWGMLCQPLPVHIKLNVVLCVFGLFFFLGFSYFYEGDTKPLGSSILRRLPSEIFQWLFDFFFFSHTLEEKKNWFQRMWLFFHHFFFCRSRVDILKCSWINIFRMMSDDDNSSCYKGLEKIVRY